MDFLNLKDSEVFPKQMIPEIYRMTPPLSRLSALFRDVKNLWEKGF